MSDDGLDGLSEGEAVGLTTAPTGDVERAALACVVSAEAEAHLTLTRMRVLAQPEDFAGPHHATLWAALLATQDRGDTIDVSMLAHDLTTTGQKAAAEVLIRVALTEVDVTHCEAYARKVAEHAHRRAVQAKVAEAHRCLQGKGQPLDVVASARTILAAIPTAVRGQRDDSMRAAMEEAMAEIKAAMTVAETGQNPGARWGVGTLDGYSVDGAYVEGVLGGLCPGKLCILGGVPAAGKTTLATQAALATARDARGVKGRRVLFFSLEMRRADLARRLVSQLCDIPETFIEQGRLSKDDHAALAHAAKELARLPIDIIEDCRTVEAIRARVLAESARGAIDPAQMPALVIVDFLQRVKTERVYRDENRADEDKVYELKGVANDAKVAVLVITSMTKTAQREAKTGDVSQTSAKGSGAEYAADLMAFLVRTDPDSHAPVVEVQLVVVKRRGGQVFAPPTLRFDRPRGLFASAGIDAQREDYRP